MYIIILGVIIGVVFMFYNTIINLLEKDRNSRRIVLSAWNPLDESKMALPPCHILCQFYIDSNDKLHCQMYQRSADMFLGIPFNIASYALLTHILAKLLDLKLGKLKICIGDAHIYKNHLSQCETQISRNPYKFPKLFIEKDLTCIKDIENLNVGDFKLENYEYHSKIGGKMAI